MGRATEITANLADPGKPVAAASPLRHHLTGATTGLTTNGPRGAAHRDFIGAKLRGSMAANGGQVTSKDPNPRKTFVARSQVTASAAAGGLRSALIVVAGAVGGFLLPALAQAPELNSWTLLFRGVLVGSVVGLIDAHEEQRWYSGALAAVASVTSSVAVFVATNQPAVLIELLVGAIVAALVAIGMQWLRRRVGALAGQTLGLLIVLLVSLWYAGIAPGPLRADSIDTRVAELSVHPQPEQYQFDGWLYVRTYDLMNEGRGYYDAFGTSVIEDSRLDETALSSVFNYREPFLFELWKALPGDDAASLWMWFIGASVLTLAAAYVLASCLVAPGAALIAPISLIPFYYYFWWTNTWFTMSEVWGGMFGLFAVTALIRGWRVTSLVFLVIAVATREFLVLLIPAWVVAWWFWGERRRTWWFLTLVVVLPVTVLGAHVVSVPPLSGSTPFDFSSWLNGGVGRLVDALRFGWAYVAIPDVTPVLLAVAALVAALSAKSAWRRWSLTAVVVLPALFLLIVSRGEWSYYWGAFFTPLAVALAPGAMGRWLAPEPVGPIAAVELGTHSDANPSE
jgi:hypothetical protein